MSIYFIPTINNNDACAICLNDLDAGAVVAHKGNTTEGVERLQCHMHTACINHWIKTNRENDKDVHCPKCKVLIGDDALEEFGSSVVKGALLGATISMLTIAFSRNAEFPDQYHHDAAWIASHVLLALGSTVILGNPEIKGNCEKSFGTFIFGSFASTATTMFKTAATSTFATSFTAATALGWALGKYIGQQAEQPTCIQSLFLRMFPSRLQQEAEDNPV